MPRACSAGEDHRSYVSNIGWYLQQHFLAQWWTRVRWRLSGFAGDSPAGPHTGGVFELGAGREGREGGTGGWFSSFHRRAGRTMNSLLPLPPDQPSAPQWLPGKVCPGPCVMNLAVLVLYSTITFVLLVLIILDIFPHIRTVMTSFNIFTWQSFVSRWNKNLDPLYTDNILYRVIQNVCQK